MRAYFLSAGRHFVQNGKIQIAVKHKRKSAGNRSGRHYQRMHSMAFSAQQRAVGYAETMLLVCNNKLAIGQKDVLLNNGMRSYNYLCLLYTSDAADE